MSERRHKALVERRGWLRSAIARAASLPGALRLALPRFLTPTRPLAIPVRFQRSLPAALPAAAGLGLATRTVHAAGVVGVRVWPSQDYTRVTLELDQALEHSHFTIASPDRLVVDIRGMRVDQAFRDQGRNCSPSSRSTVTASGWSSISTRRGRPIRWMC